ncbi:LPS-assembly protein LptD [Methylacidiphilum fumariolicum]|nr:LPS-assembly protein LptD [Candidatus Methylacidiphilum fumarolicum]MBW6414925.1 LPS-assembly protein LptD [Candidatus Methylacidiphilum fumarolicum]
MKILLLPFFSFFPKLMASKKGPFFVVLACLLITFSLSSFAQDSDETETEEEQQKVPPGQIPVEITAEETHFVGNIAVAKGNAVAHYGATDIYADEISYDSVKREVIADGNARVYTEKRVFRASHIVYNLDTKAITALNWSLFDTPLLSSGQTLTTPEEDHYHVENGMFTVENREHPYFQTKAKTIDIYANDKIVMKNVTVYMGKIPVLWLPVVSQPLNSEESSYNIIPGERSYWGWFVTFTYNYKFSEKAAATFQLDYRSLRGPAGGAILKFIPSEGGMGFLRTYYANDFDFQLNPTSIPRFDVGPNRGMFNLAMKMPLTQEFTLSTDLNYWTDPYVLEDFLWNTYMYNRQPDNVAWLNYYNSNFTADLLVRDNLMPFFNSINRLPELSILTNRTRIFNTPIAYQSRYSVVNFEQQFSNLNFTPGNIFGLFYPWQPLNRFLFPLARTQTLTPAQLLALPSPYFLSNYGGYRWDTYQELSYPKEYFHWLSVTPRIGFEGTYWSDQNVLSAVPTASRLDFSRALFVAGLESSFKLSKVWENVDIPLLGIHGIRHVVQPFMNFQYIPNPYDNPYQVLGFDNFLPTITPPVINLMNYPSIDSLFGMTYLRSGIRQRIQTKRDGNTYNLAEFTAFVDANWDRKYNQLLIPMSDTVDEVYGVLDINPVPWFNLHSDIALPTADLGYTNWTTAITYQFHRANDLTFGYSYLNNVEVPVSFLTIPLAATFPAVGPNGMSSLNGSLLNAYQQAFIGQQNTVFISDFWRINKDWQVMGMLTYQGTGGYIPFENFTIYRDLQDWVFSFNFQNIMFPGSPSIQMYYIALTLKAFPSLKVDYGWGSGM